MGWLRPGITRVPRSLRGAIRALLCIRRRSGGRAQPSIEGPAIPGGDQETPSRRREADASANRPRELARPQIGAARLTMEIPEGPMTEMIKLLQSENPEAPN